jgi:hypothetical protein
MRALWTLKREAMSPFIFFRKRRTPAKAIAPAVGPARCAALLAQTKTVWGTPTLSRMSCDGKANHKCKHNCCGINSNDRGFD